MRQPQRLREHRPGVHTGVELAALAAGVGTWRQFAEQGGVELAAGESAE